MAIKVLNKFLIALAIINICSGSAIPMWEFLNRNEKMSHLYSTFAKFVSDYCKQGNDVLIHNLSVAQCKHDLLKYGSDKLQKMSDNSLDLLDPYQRNANDLIWSTIMSGHPTVQASKRPTLQAASSSLKPKKSSAEASILIFGNKNKFNGYNFPKNPIFDDKHSTYAESLDAAYGNYGDKKFQNRYPDGSGPYITGPLVFRVKPDGTPVEGQQQLPRDDDREAGLQLGYQFQKPQQRQANYYGNRPKVQPQYYQPAQQVIKSSNNGNLGSQGQLQRERRQYLNSNSYRIQRRH